MDRGVFIDGKWQMRSGLERLAIADPATGDHVGSTLLADEGTVDEAVQAAERAAPQMAAMLPDERAAILNRAAHLIEKRADDMARLLTREQGKPVADNRKEILFGATVLRYYAQEATRIWGTLRPAMAPGIKNIVSYHPIGVAAAIVPWNYPVDLYCWKVGPAIAAGCPLIVKSPPETPLAIAMLVDCLHEAGIPDGALADIPGHGPVAGAALARHDRIRALSATASIAAGQDIMRNAAGNLKKLCLELGGNAPLIVMADADLQEAAKAAHRRSFSNMGQICITVNRVLVDKSVYGEFCSIMAELTEATVLGHGIDPGVEYGPVLNASVIERVEQHKTDALAKGGKLLAGGKRPEDSAFSAGHFYRPTLIGDAPLNSLPMCSETYGPLAAVAPFENVDEMIDMANGPTYGLAAYIYGKDLDRMWTIADRIECGGVGINVNDVSELQAPFGGWKMSGNGRELGPEALETYLEPKLVKMRLRSAT
ncbi:aldehyde dehydrogenase family protein [Hoeflea prorocentri]|uniref:Aldehyde dehydrogenase family protein n=1 Tax=Hoeflea prorocentri TaxID=1922333 RepID=A0A9X3ZGF6_9HYPH|nr:aldehyde dehydrogenase family protein [Hoeflea prorocentri]MCY6380189.1 aldehyde dehydrogenase family protein [Hoeflea prorocentri]MDA5397989.1 aldehyde dehydrogenase family protein [Hoeflea prorocentri]